MPVLPCRSPIWGAAPEPGRYAGGRLRRLRYSVVMVRIRAVVRVLRRLVADERLPGPVRWLLVFGLLPIPGPVDEAALVLAALLLLCYRRRVREILAHSSAA